MHEERVADGGPESDDAGREFSPGADGTVVDLDPSADGVTTAVTEAVVRRSGRDPLTLPPLQTVVDCDALESLFGGRREGRADATGITATFEYVGYDVTVGGGRVVVEETTR